MTMSGARVRVAAEQIWSLLTLGARQSRCSVCAYSVAPQQRSSGGKTTVGDGTGGDESTDKTPEKTPEKVPEKVAEKIPEKVPERTPETAPEMTPERRAIKLEQEVRDLTERYQRAVRDSETIMARTKKFVEDAKIFGIQSFCRDLVEVADILDEAVGKAGHEGRTDMSDILSTVNGKLQSVFTKHGLHKMTPMGSDYDPYDHQIVCHVPTREIRPGSIATVSRDGYKLHGRTIRHAHVGLAVETNPNL